MYLSTDGNVRVRCSQSENPFLEVAPVYYACDTALGTSAVPASVSEAGLLHGHVLLITRRETEDQLRSLKPLETSLEN